MHVETREWKFKSGTDDDQLVKSCGSAAAPVGMYGCMRLISDA